MEIKDWVILFIPIILEGIGIFWLQKYMSDKFDKKLEVRNRKQEVIISYQNKIAEISFIFNNMRYQKDMMNEVMLGLKKLDLDLVEYFDLHKEILKEITEDHKMLIIYANNFINATKNVSNINFIALNDKMKIIRDQLYLLSSKCDQLLNSI